MPAISDRHEAKAEAQDPTRHSGGAVGKTEYVANDDDRGAGERGNGVEIRT